MIVVSDASPIIALAAVGQLKLLRRLYGKVYIPPTVYFEITHSKTLPGTLVVLEEMKAYSQWLQLMEVYDDRRVKLLSIDLDKGEAEAIALADEITPDLLLMDERRGRKFARALGIKVTGILGVLIEAKTKNYITEVKPILEDLAIKISFRISEALYQRVLEVAGET